jgi:site-specific DNA recombinase
MKQPVIRKLRCAVYTRKSSEEGLEQEFNSLDAQREACEAYIASQKAEGWLLVPDYIATDVLKHDAPACTVPRHCRPS